MQPKEEEHSILQVMARMQILEPSQDSSGDLERMPPVRGLRHAMFVIQGHACMLPRCGATLRAEPEEGGMLCVLCEQPYPSGHSACVYCGLRVREHSLMKALEVPSLLAWTVKFPVREKGASAEEQK